MLITRSISNCLIGDVGGRQRIWSCSRPYSSTATLIACRAPPGPAFFIISWVFSGWVPAYFQHNSRPGALLRCRATVSATNASRRFGTQIPATVPNDIRSSLSLARDLRKSREEMFGGLSAIVLLCLPGIRAGVIWRPSASHW